MKGFTTVTLSFVLLLISHTSFPSVEHNPLFSKNWTSIASISTNDIPKTFRKLSELDIDIAGVNYTEGTVDVLLADYDFISLKELDFSISIKETKGVSRGPDEEYKNPEEIELILENLSVNHPHLTKKILIGKSLEGRDIWALKISDNPDQEELEEPSVLFNSMHHAREVMTPEISIDIMEYLLEKYSIDPKVKKWVDNYTIWVIPMFNVDGNNKMWKADRWWRKNTRDGHGVDLNRNYPTGWNKCNGSSGRRSSQTYRGKAPASEPETQAMMSFIEKVRPVFDISYHAYSELVIFPFGCSGERTSTKEVVETIGKEVAQKLNYKAGTAWELLYNADGGDIDWMYDAYQVIPYVIEVNSSKQGFQPNYKRWRDVTVEKNRAGWMHILERLGKSAVRGQLISNSDIDDLSIIVRKSTSLDSIFLQYKPHENGFFHIVLNPGAYLLEIVDNNKIIKSESIEINDIILRRNIEF